MKNINRIGVTVAFVGLIVGALWLLSKTGALDSSLVASLTILALLLAAVAAVVARGVRQRTNPLQAKARAKTSFAVVLRTHHEADPISLDDANTILHRLFSDPSSLGQVLDARRCKDCGHEDIILRSGHDDEVFRLTSNTRFVEQRLWFFGLFALRLREDPIASLPDA